MRPKRPLSAVLAEHGGVPHLKLCLSPVLMDQRWKMKHVFELPLLIFHINLIFAISPFNALSTAIQTNVTLLNAGWNGTLSQISDMLGARIATRQLIEHDVFMRIEYYPLERLPNPSYKEVLSNAFLDVTIEIHQHGDEALLHNEYFHIQQGDLHFYAGKDQHSPMNTFSYGILQEAIEVLTDFLNSRPYAIQCYLLEGMMGRGPPVGEVFMLEDIQGETRNVSISQQ